MAKQEVTAVQVQMAAAAGAKLLQQDDLPVPMSIAKSGALSVLEGMLQALANGEVVLTQAPVADIPQPPGLPADAGNGKNNGGDGDGPAVAPVESTKESPKEE